MKHIKILTFWIILLITSSCSSKKYLVKSVGTYGKIVLIELERKKKNIFLISNKVNVCDSNNNETLLEIKLRDTIKLNLQLIPTSENPLYKSLSNFQNRSGLFMDGKLVYKKNYRYYRSNCVLGNYIIRDCCTR